LIIIKKVKRRNYIQKEDKITSFNIIGQLKSGIEIKIVDYNPFKLKKTNYF
jgi:hypothetical protein